MIDRFVQSGESVNGVNVRYLPVCPSGGRPVSTAYTPTPLSVEYLSMSEIQDIEKVANSYTVM